MPSEPIQLATLPASTLLAEQWRLAVLLMQSLSRPLTIDEVRAEIDLLAKTINDANYSWQV